MPTERCHDASADSSPTPLPQCGLTFVRPSVRRSLKVQDCERHGLPASIHRRLSERLIGSSRPGSIVHFVDAATFAPTQMSPDATYAVYCATALGSSYGGSVNASNPVPSGFYSSRMQPTTLSARLRSRMPPPNAGVGPMLDHVAVLSDPHNDDPTSPRRTKNNFDVEGKQPGMPRITRSSSSNHPTLETVTLPASPSKVTEPTMRAFLAQSSEPKKPLLDDVLRCLTAFISTADLTTVTERMVVTALRDKLGAERGVHYTKKWLHAQLDHLMSSPAAKAGIEDGQGESANERDDGGESQKDCSHMASGGGGGGEEEEEVAGCVRLNVSTSSRTNLDPRTRHSSTLATKEVDGWLDDLQIFSHKGELIINEKGKKQVVPSYDKGWQAKSRDTNFASTAIACILGERSGVCVLDFDEPSLYNKLLADYSDRCWPTVKTQRGFHVYFEYSGHTKAAFDSLPKAVGKLDLKRDGQIWFPGCRVKQRDGSSFRYEWMLHDRLSNGVGLLCHMPTDLIDEITAMAHARHEASPPLPPPPSLPPSLPPPAPPRAISAPCSSDLTPDQKRAALITGEHVQEHATWFQIMCAMRNSQCTKGDAIALTTRYLQASGKRRTSRFEKLDAAWDGAMATSNATAGTIVHHAKLCDPKALSTLRREEKKAMKLNAAETASTTEKDNSQGEAGLFAEGEATDLQLASAFLELEGTNFIYQDQTMYAYFDSMWRLDAGCELLRNVFMHRMTNYLADMIQEPSGRDRKAIAKALYNCQTPFKVNGMIAAIKSLLAAKLQTVLFDTGPEQHYNIQFKNCLYDLKKKEARKRTATDYITQTLDYDYMPRESISDEIHREVRESYQKLQPDETQRRFQLGYLAYAITGNTAHQIAKMNIGYSAGNGKSTELKIHRACFGMYTTKLDKRTFNRSYEKSHKELIGLLRNPIRLAYIEELDRDQLDEDRYKDFVDGHELSVEVLYSTKTLAPHQAKLMTCSNKDPNITADQGVKRRTKCQLYSSKFVEEADDNYETHVYRKVLGFEERFRAPEYRNAYFHLLLEHVDQLVVPQSAAELFTQIAEENDDFRNTLDIVYEVTGDTADRISRRDLMEGLNTAKRSNNDRAIKWPDVLSNLKRLGLKYVRDERIQSTNGFGDVIRDRGAIHGLKVRVDEDDVSDSSQERGVLSFVSRCHA